jgi:hypothetical protein
MRYLKQGFAILLSVGVVFATLFITGLLVKVIWKVFLAGFNLW